MWKSGRLERCSNNPQTRKLTNRLYLSKTAAYCLIWGEVEVVRILHRVGITSGSLKACLSSSVAAFIHKWVITRGKGKIKRSQEMVRSETGLVTGIIMKVWRIYKYLSYIFAWNHGVFIQLSTIKKKCRTLEWLTNLNDFIVRNEEPSQHLLHSLVISLLEVNEIWNTEETSQGFATDCLRTLLVHYVQKIIFSGFLLTRRSRTVVEEVYWGALPRP